MNKKRLFTLFSSFIVLGGLFSCGEASGNSSNVAGSSTTGSNVSESVSSGDDSGTSVTITFWHTFGQSIVDTLNKKITAFKALVKEHDGVDVNVELAYKGGYNDILSIVKNGFSAGNVPTIAVAYPDHVAEYLAGELKDEQFVVNMEKFVSDPEIGFGKESWYGDGEASDFVQGFYQEGTNYAKKGLYSLPFMKSTEVMFYNKTLLGSAIPKYYDSTLNTSGKIDTYLKNMSWDQLLAVAKAIKDNQTAISSTLKTPIYYDSDSNMYISQSYQKNIPYLSLNTDGTGSVDFVNDQAKALVQSYKDAKDAGYLTTKGVKGTYGSDSFKNVESVFSIGSSGGTGYQLPSGDSFEVGVCKVPSMSAENPVYVNQGPTLTILNNPGKDDATNAKRAKYAWKFLKYITSAEINTQMCVIGSEGYSPVRTSAYATDLYQQYLEEGETYAKTAKVVSDQVAGHYLISPTFKGSAVARTEVGGIVTQVLLGNKTIDKAFEDAYNETKKSM
ncbi:MAG: hypothetical protein LKJ88_00030 [Bacilli bacterium]|jgi:multiple sugar transport system substrate-binding protein|nr:hypothetical protein [Bacilli bacterium]